MWSRIVDVAVLEALAATSRSRCGALVIDSCPPATTISNSPARISWSASAIASSPDRHTLLMVSAGTVIGMPALTAAWRAGIWPAPAVQHLAHDHVVDLVRAARRPLERALDRDAAEVGAGEVLERAEQAAHRGAGSGDDDASGGIGALTVGALDQLVPLTTSVAVAVTRTLHRGCGRGRDHAAVGSRRPADCLR